jgi:hypothetical protein
LLKEFCALSPITILIGGSEPESSGERPEWIFGLNKASLEVHFEGGGSEYAKDSFNSRNHRRFGTCLDCQSGSAGRGLFGLFAE